MPPATVTRHTLRRVEKSVIGAYSSAAALDVAVASEQPGAASFWEQYLAHEMDRVNDQVSSIYGQHRPSAINWGGPTIVQRPGSSS